MNKKGFDERIVYYEYIHNISTKDKNILIHAINPKSNEKILDAFCGYGFVGKECLKRNKNIYLILNDESKIQLNRAKENLKNADQTNFILGNFLNIKFQKYFFDKVIIKMGLHEVQKNQQLKILKKCFEILKPDGKLIIWDIILNKENQNLFQNIIRKKDDLAGFKILANKRYFFTKDELMNNIKESGFSKVKEIHTINYRFSSKRRLEQELNSNKKKLDELNNFIRNNFTDKLKRYLNYNDLGDDIKFTIKKKIYVIKK